MNLRSLQTHLVFTIGGLWTVMTVLAGLGYWYAGLFILLAMLLLFLLLGASRNGRLDKVLAVPLVGFVCLWAVAFGLAKYHADLFADRVPDWTMLGFHPSFGWMVLLYWLGATCMLAFGYYVLRDRWLSKADWQAFLDDVKPEGDRHGS